MSKTKRKSTSDNQDLVLYGQSRGICPLCTRQLLYTKNGRKYKEYDTAHIYPLNPSPEETALLKEEDRLHEDVNNIDNLILLCKGCHTKFDKPRTVSEYRRLFNVKQGQLVQHANSEMISEFGTNSYIKKLTNRIVSEGVTQKEEGRTPLVYKAVTTDEKLGDAIPSLARSKVKFNASSYFIQVRRHLQMMEQEDPGVTDILLASVRLFYLQSSKTCLAEIDVLHAIRDWFSLHGDIGDGESQEAAEIMTAFFIQNCEAFS